MKIALGVEYDGKQYFCWQKQDKVASVQAELERAISHPFATRHPRSKLLCAAVRLACVKHAASVQSEPGSNSYVQSLTF